MLQYEAQYHATKFNEGNPPSKIHFIRAYAIEFPERQGRPWMAVERFIEGCDSYGAGFVKHNTNSGFVDTDLRRVTPQVFSAFSFYASQGQRLVADIQGVGDLYTDPQVLSCDYRFGDGDLGPRGMALFFKTFRHCGMSDSMGIPIFPLSKNEMKVQAKYNEDEETISDEDASAYSGDGLKPNNKFQRLDVNRLRRSLALKSPRDLLGPNESATMRRSNVSRLDISKSIRSSLRGGSHFKVILRTSSDVDELQMCLERAKKDLEFTLRHDFHRSASGDLRARHFKTGDKTYFHKSNVFCAVSAPMIPSEETENNLGKVHYQLAVLHGSERFPDVVPDHPGDNREDRPSHDAFSVLFHLSYAAALQNAPACLALARLHAGLGTVVSDLLSFVVSTDFEAAKDLLRRAMASSQLPSKPKAAAGCLLFHLLHDEVALQEGNTSSEFIMQVVEDTLELLVVTEKEAEDVKIHNSRLERGAGMYVGDKVEANYAMEGTLYSAVVVAVSEDGESITVAYDDDGSEETHTKENVKVLIASTATQTAEGAPLSDEEAFGSEAGDDKFLLSLYELKAELADLKEKVGDKSTASRLYEEAADGAMTDGKMQTATKWSIKAAELQP